MKQAKKCGIGSKLKLNTLGPQSWDSRTENFVFRLLGDNSFKKTKICGPKFS